MISTIILWVLILLLGGILAIMFLGATLATFLYIFGESEKERGERVYRTYTEWQKNRIKEGGN